MIGRVFAWMERVADHSHRSDLLAARWHRMHAVVCAAAVACFIGECVYHLGAKRLHQRHAARRAADPPDSWRGP